MAAENPIQRALRDAREGRLQEAIASLRFLAKRQPNNPDPLQVLGLLLTQAGQTEQALVQLARAVALAPQVPAYRSNYANALLGAGKAADAAAQYRKATELDPRYEKAWLGLALAATRVGDTEAALAACARGRALRSPWPELARAEAMALEEGDRIDEAVEVLSAAVAASPRDAELRGRLLLALNYTDVGAAEIAAAHRAYGGCVAGAMRAPAARASGGPLRVGVLSGDLRTHSVGYFADAFLRKAAGEVEWIVFSTVAPVPGDAMMERFRAAADAWVECAFLDDAALDAAIRARELDVLLELSGHTAGSRLQAISAKPAPVVVSAIGYPNTTGHPAVDWRIVDSTTDPAGSDSLATERLLRLDPCFLCYVPSASAPEPSMPAADAPPTFGSFNLSTKVCARTVEAWSAAMRAVAESRLLVKSRALEGRVAREHFLARLEAGGIARERVEIVAYTRGVAEHFALYSRVHVALDTMPYNGTTTTCEALWMGVPVVTIEGDRHAARVGASLLRAAGRGQWVARNTDEFAGIAARLAGDRAALAALRGEMRDSLRSSALLDQAGYRARFLDALRAAAGRGLGAR
ncbi:MAG: tetratricopeptide repeat protein [Planctomycetota bacterium]